MHTHPHFVYITSCTHCMHTHILHTYLYVHSHTCTLCMYTLIHTPHIHSYRQHTCTHSTPSTPYVCMHIPLVCTHHEHMQTQMHTHVHAHVYWKELRHRPTASCHSTYSSEHLSCAIQTLKNSCPCSTCVSECYRAAVSGDPPHSEHPQSCSFRGPPPRAIPASYLQCPYPTPGLGQVGSDSKDGGAFPCPRLP